jgi:hypothetical protein
VRHCDRERKAEDGKEGRKKRREASRVFPSPRPGGGHFRWRLLEKREISAVVEEVDCVGGGGVADREEEMRKEFCMKKSGKKEEVW